MKTQKVPTLSQAEKILTTVRAGLCRGKGQPKPGQMCVEAAVCYGMGLPHSDDPPCVDSVIRSFKISLNDRDWSSNAARAQGLEKIAIAQLGTAGMGIGKEFAKRLAEKTIRKIIPKVFRTIAAVAALSSHSASLNAAADRCENEGTADAANAAAYAANAANAAAYADAADAAKKHAEIRDEYLGLSASLAVETLRELNSPGIGLMDQLIPPPTPPADLSTVESPSSGPSTESPELIPARNGLSFTADQKHNFAHWLYVLDRTTRKQKKGSLGKEDRGYCCLGIARVCVPGMQHQASTDGGLDTPNCELLGLDQTVPKDTWVNAVRHLSRNSRSFRRALSLMKSGLGSDAPSLSDIGIIANDRGGLNFNQIARLFRELTGIKPKRSPDATAEQSR